MPELGQLILNFDFVNTATLTCQRIFRGRVRGKAPRYQPYLRRHDDDDTRLPHPTSEHRLTGSTPEERMSARERDNVRVAKDWKTYFMKYFEREKYTILRPLDSHRVPEANTLNTIIDENLSNTKTQVKEVIETHLDTVIEAAEERLRNPHKPAEMNLLEQVTKLVQQQQLDYEFMLKNMGRTINEILQQREEKQKAQPEPSHDPETNSPGPL